MRKHTRPLVLGTVAAMATFVLFYLMTLFMSLGLALMGMTYGPLGTYLAELFPPTVRYTGSSLTFNLGGILGASLAPYAATWLASNWGLQYVGYYLTAASLVTLAALLLTERSQADVIPLPRTA